MEKETQLPRMGPQQTVLNTRTKTVWN